MDTPSAQGAHRCRKGGTALRLRGRTFTSRPALRHAVTHGPSSNCVKKEGQSSRRRGRMTRPEIGKVMKRLEGRLRARMLKSLARPDTERLVEAGIQPSVGSIGDSYDNALAETVHGLFKTEFICRRGPGRSLGDSRMDRLVQQLWPPPSRSAICRQPGPSKLLCPTGGDVSPENSSRYK